jgi:branched-subunit amino acid aminotransferase/4-amino-4-deoxychorismate lyase
VTEPLVYLNGRLVPAAEANLPVIDTGIVLGATVTEQIRTIHKRLYRLGDHLGRLYRSMRYAHMELGMAPEELAAISHRLAAHNGRFLNEGGELGLVHFVTAGEYAAYAGTTGRPARTTPTLCVHTFPLPFERWAKQMQQGAHLVTPSVRQVPAQCVDPRVKCRSRMHYYLGEREVQRVDPEASALLLDLDGKATETGAANVLMVQRGTLVSPPAAGTLAGVSRATVIDLAGRLDIPFTERDLRVFDLVNADEVFLASTPYCLMPVTRINGVAVGDGKPGPVYQKLIETWGKEVKLDIVGQIIEGARRRREQAAAPGGGAPDDLVYRGCTTPVIHILEQVPARAADRSLTALDGATAVTMALWTLLRWERKLGLAALERSGVKVTELAHDLDGLLTRKGDENPAAVQQPHALISVKTQQVIAPLDIEGLLDPLVEQARVEARKLGHVWVGTEHLLLAIIASADRELAGLLERHKVFYEKVKGKVLELVKG